MVGIESSLSIGERLGQMRQLFYPEEVLQKAVDLLVSTVVDLVVLLRGMAMSFAGVRVTTWVTTLRACVAMVVLLGCPAGWCLATLLSRQ